MKEPAVALRIVNRPAAPSNYRKGRLRSVRVGVAHGTVTPPGPPNAANVGGFFAQNRPKNPSSAHVTVDGGHVAVRSVADGDTAFAAPNTNADGLHLELCMQPTRDIKVGKEFWATDLGQDTLADGAEIMGAWAAKYHLPIRWLSPRELAAGQSGLTDHATVSAAYKGGHWDVGMGFPVEQWLQLVLVAANGPKVVIKAKAPVHRVPAPAAPRFPGVMRIGSTGAGVRALQARLAARGWKVTVDGQYGPGTAGILAKFQAEKRLKVDGVCGPLTWAALHALPVTR
jgi:hypothetical protein